LRPVHKFSSSCLKPVSIWHGVQRGFLNSRSFSDSGFTCFLGYYCHRKYWMFTFSSSRVLTGNKRTKPIYVISSRISTPNRNLKNLEGILVTPHWYGTTIARSNVFSFTFWLMLQFLFLCPEPNRLSTYMQHYWYEFSCEWTPRN
jgi:hypothetical protein